MEHEANWQRMARRLGLLAAFVWVLYSMLNLLHPVSYQLLEYSWGEPLVHWFDNFLLGPFYTYPWLDSLFANLSFPAACLLAFSLVRASRQAYRTMTRRLVILSALMALVLLESAAFTLQMVREFSPFLPSTQLLFMAILSIQLALAVLVPFTLIHWPRIGVIVCVAIPASGYVYALVPPDDSAHLKQQAEVEAMFEDWQQETPPSLAEANSAALAIGLDEPPPENTVTTTSRTVNMTGWPLSFAYLAMAAFAFQWHRKKREKDACPAAG